MTRLKTHVLNTITFENLNKKVNDLQYTVINISRNFANITNNATSGGKIDLLIMLNYIIVIIALKL